MPSTKSAPKKTKSKFNPSAPRKAKPGRYMIQAVCSEVLHFRTKAVASSLGLSVTEFLMNLILKEIRRVAPEQLQGVPEAEAD